MRRLPPSVPPRTELRDARIRAGLTQPDLARRLGITYRTVLQIEKGNKHPSFMLMQQWASLLGISVDMFDSGRGKKAAE